jgi:hypothetical protein
LLEVKQAAEVISEAPPHVPWATERMGGKARGQAGQGKSCDASPKRAMNSSAVLGAPAAAGAVAAIAEAMLRYAMPGQENAAQTFQRRAGAVMDP